jgi:hypothetical protein
VAGVIVIALRVAGRSAAVDDPAVIKPTASPPTATAASTVRPAIFCTCRRPFRHHDR